MKQESGNPEIPALALRLGDMLENGRGGLPQEVFYLVSRLTPMVNVDLLIRDESGRVLLTWRGDEFYGPGWHIPGGIIRFKETAADRIAAVARQELATTVVVDQYPCKISEIMSCKRDVRGHFISLLYGCRLSSPLLPAMQAREAALQNGMWKWFEHYPENMIPVHEIYKEFFAASLA